ncbi:hypothetical protein BPUM_2982 [Bacillus pumilus SAFR-032]|uniref:Uncharacterized protein n=1 Tax=Bacillus pumilus (strain SAFR-032) TaxID=315750 RepID=A8FHB9_BACP2|nr:hypothetical protein BPUM_2982 [Bacillus pumilus SAFR-032]
MKNSLFRGCFFFYQKEKDAFRNHIYNLSAL